MKPCIFCGKAADSKEDLFSRWILKRVVTRQPLYRKMGDAPPEITENQEVRIPCVCQQCNNTWMSGMETTVKKFLGPMIEDLTLPLDRQNQQNLAEWAVKGAMINDTVDPHPRFFTEAESHAFKLRRREDACVCRSIHRPQLGFERCGLQLTEPESGNLLVRSHVYNLMIGHVVLQVLSWHPEPLHEGKIIRFKALDGPWDKLTIQVWPVGKKSVTWPPAMSLSTVFGATHYAYFRMRFKNENGHPAANAEDEALIRSGGWPAQEHVAPQFLHRVPHSKPGVDLVR